MPAHLITDNLEANFRAALQSGSFFGNALRDVARSNFMNPEALFERAARSATKENLPPPLLAATGDGLRKAASSGIIYTQPQFFSPIHTPINWQIPSKRKEIYQWSRYYFENEPKVATAIEFYSRYPINGFEHECEDRYVKHFFDKLADDIHLLRWLRIISHEVHLLGDCFPFLEVHCDACGGRGVVDNKVCNHEGGSFRRIVVLNPEYVEVYSDPMTPDQMIAFIPNDELRNLIMKHGPGSERFSQEIRGMIAAGVPIPLDNRNVSHLKYADNGYNRYGTGMVRRLFPVLAYKTKLMTAQWIVAERLILPIKVVKIGSDTRPASAQDLANAQSQMAQVANDPNLTIITHHAFELDWFGAAGKVLQLTNEFEIINQEVLDGLAINKALLNGEGPTYSNAAIGVEVMIDKLETWRDELAEFVEQKIYLPIAMMRGFVQKNEWGEQEFVYPRIKWNLMHLRDQQQHRTFMLQLHERQLISNQRLLESFDIDYDEEVENMRWERAQGVMGAPQPGAGMGGGFGGGPPAGGGGGGLPPLPDIGGGGDMGNPADSGAAGGMASPGGGGGGGGLGGGLGGMAQSSTANITEFGGKVLSEKTREKIRKQRERMFRQHSQGNKDGSGFQRDVRGRFNRTGPEKELLRALADSAKQGNIGHNVYAQFPVKFGSTEYTIDFAMPDIKLGIEVDGAIFHEPDEQQARDGQRDRKLASLGWTILRFTDREVEVRSRQVIDTIIRYMGQKENWLRAQGRE